MLMFRQQFSVLTAAAAGITLRRAVESNHQVSPRMRVFKARCLTVGILSKTHVSSPAEQEIRLTTSTLRLHVLPRGGHR